jgi:hypothetical protein
MFSAKEMRDVLLLAMDPATFARSVGLDPDPWQEQVLRSLDERLLLLCSRQTGKSTTTAVLALHTALYVPNSLVLLLSPSLRQSSELFRKVLGFYHTLPQEQRGEAETTLHVEFANGSRILSLPGTESTVRGYSGVTLLIVDEASRVPDELYFSVRPMLAVSRGRLIAMTTPFGKRGWFYDAWDGGAPSWRRVKVVAADCPRISADFLAEERVSLGPWWYAQEYDCEFLDTTDQVFASDLVQAALSHQVEALCLSS